MVLATSLQSPTTMVQTNVVAVVTRVLIGVSETLCVRLVTSRRMRYWVLGNPRFTGGGYRY